MFRRERQTEPGVVRATSVNPRASSNRQVRLRRPQGARYRQLRQRLIGLDDVEAYITPKEASSYFESGRPASTATTDFHEIFRRMHDPGVQILDVRSRSEYEQEHLHGALHIPHTRLLDHLDDIPRGKELLVHCATGIRSAVASALLQRHGFVVRYVDDDFRKAPESSAG